MTWRVPALYAALLALQATAFAAPPATGDITCQDPVVSGTAFTMKCAYEHQSMPLTLVMHGKIDDDRAVPETIEVRADGKLRQTLTVESNGVELNSLATQAFTSIDLNFDGYDDLQVWTATSAGPNSGYAFWLYDPAKMQFDRREDLDDKFSGFELDSDPAAKTIGVSGRVSCCAWEVATYQWVGTQLLQTIDVESGGIIYGLLAPDGPLADVPSVQAFVKASGDKGAICATRTDTLDATGAITKEVIETDGGPCADDGSDDYRSRAIGLDKTLNGTRRHGNVTDLYKAGILLRRTIVYDPPKKASP